MPGSSVRMQSESGMIRQRRPVAAASSMMLLDDVVHCESSQLPDQLLSALRSPCEPVCHPS